MEFGLPKKRVVKQEKYPDQPVLTLAGFEKGETKKRRRILSLNKCAVEHGIHGFKELALHFNPTNTSEVLVLDATGIEEVGESLAVNKSGNISNKKYYEALRNTFGVESEEEHLELELVDSGRRYQDRVLFKLSKLKDITTLSNTQTTTSYEAREPEEEVHSQLSL